MPIGAPKYARFFFFKAAIKGKRPFFFSYLIYTVSQELEDTIQSEGTESGYTGIVKRILQESGLQGVILNSWIVNVFKKKVSLLRSAIKIAARRSGVYIKKLKAKWQKETYSFKIFYHEIEVCQLHQVNRELRGQKRKLESSLADEQAKRLKVEEKLEQVVNKAEKKENYYKKKFKVLARKITKMQKDRKRGPDKRKKFTEYSKPHQSRLRQQMKENCQATLSFLGLYDFIATKVEVYNSDTEQYETFSLIDQNDIQLKENIPTELTDEDIDDINMWIYYPTLLRRVQISCETSTNITRYLYSSHSSRPRKVQNLGKSEFWEKKSLDNKSLIRRFGV